MCHLQVLIMYVIIAYDVESRKNTKILKILRKYCYHEQNSVFDGELTPVQFKALKNELNNICSEDKVTYYTILNPKSVQKETNRNDSRIIYG